MRVAVVSDIHGNRQALEAVLAEVERADVEELWCLGDIVGYGADPGPCVALIRERCDVCIVGNHDLCVRGDLSPGEFSRAAAAAARWTRQQLDGVQLDYLRTLEPAWLSSEVGLYHASPRDPVWEYVLTPDVAALCLDAQAHRVCLIGHSHLAMTFSRSGSPVARELRGAGEELSIVAGHWLINPGSVGQPRDGDRRAAWLVLDTERWTVSFRRSDYDVAAAARAIVAAGLPAVLAERLWHGQ